MKIDRLNSYTSADAVPVKLLMAERPEDLRPIHAQWAPTNLCNLNCPFCSCAHRNQKLQMDVKKAAGVIEELARRGCRAVTITGGGEPLCHPDICKMIESFVSNGIAVGLVTNGTLLQNLPTSIIKMLTWCRISHSDYRSFTEEYQSSLDSVVTETTVDWAFSYVVSHEPKLQNIVRLVSYANTRHFTHIRLVSDLLSPEEVPMDVVAQSLSGIDRSVIYQPRKHYERCDRCLIGYVKPFIAPDFRVYMCCGVQYALEPMSLDLPDELCLGSALDMDAIYENVQPQSVRCLRCYYKTYNSVLMALTRNLRVSHGDFI